MYINEIVPESKLMIVCQVGKDKRSFPVTAIRAYEDNHALLINPIRYNGKLINFNIADISAETVLDEKKAIIFQLDKLTIVSIKKQPYHCLWCEKDTSPVNRREAVRVPMGIPCKLKYGRARTEVDCYVHDISSTGISFTIKTEADIKEGTTLTGVFNYGEPSVTYRIHSKAVHVSVNEETGYLTVGSKFSAASSEIEKLVMAVQREVAQKRSKR